MKNSDRVRERRRGGRMEADKSLTVLTVKSDRNGEKKREQESEGARERGRAERSEENCRLRWLTVLICHFPLISCQK